MSFKWGGKVVVEENYMTVFQNKVHFDLRFCIRAANGLCRTASNPTEVSA